MAKQKKQAIRQISFKPIHIAGEELDFKVHIDDHSDVWTPGWSPTNVYGRMDPISFFKGVQRTLDLQLYVIATDKAEAAENTQKIQKLLQYQYPKYAITTGGQKTVIAPPYFRLKWVNVFSSDVNGEYLYGYLNGPINVNLEAKTGDLFFNSKKDPKFVFFKKPKISLRFQVLHHGDLVGWSRGEDAAVNFGMGSTYPYGVDDDLVEQMEKDVAARTAEKYTPLVSDPNRLNNANVTDIVNLEGTVPQKTDSASNAASAARAKEVNKHSNIKPMDRVNLKILGMS